MSLRQPILRALLCCFALLLGFLSELPAIGPDSLRLTDPTAPSEPLVLEEPAVPAVVTVYLAAYRPNGPPVASGAHLNPNELNPTIDARRPGLSVSLVIIVIEVGGDRPSAWVVLYGYAGGDPVNRWDPSGLDWEWSETKKDWEYVPGGPDFQKPPKWITPAMLGGTTYLTFMDNLFMSDAYKSANSAADPAQRFTQTYLNLKQMMRTISPIASKSVIERAMNLVGNSLYNVPELRPDTWAYNTSDWIQERVATAGEFYQEQSEDGNWVVGGLGATATVFAGGAGDALRVGESSGRAWAEGADAKDWVIALAEDGGRAASLALTAAPAAAGLRDGLAATGTLGQRLSAARAGYRTGGIGAAGDSAVVARYGDEPWDDAAEVADIIRAIPEVKGDQMLDLTEDFVKIRPYREIDAAGGTTGQGDIWIARELLEHGTPGQISRVVREELMHRMRTPGLGSTSGLSRFRQSVFKSLYDNSHLFRSIEEAAAGGYAMQSRIRGALYGLNYPGVRKSRVLVESAALVGAIVSPVVSYFSFSGD